MYDFKGALIGDRETCEPGRLAALADLQIVEGGPEETFDRMARLARASLNFPIAYVSLIDLKRQILKTNVDVRICDGSRETAFCALTIEEREPLIIPDTLADPRVAGFPQVVEAPFVRAYWGAPLTTRAGYNIGAFCVLDYRPRHPSAADVEMLSDFGRLAVECMELRAQATTDVLTGVQSRRSFLAEGERLFARRHSERQPLSCVALDVDHFKRINDNFGHAAGDDVLRDLGNLLRAEIRSDALVGRIGGEEFVVLLPGENLRGAYAVAERLRQRIKQTSIAGPPPLTASFGISERRRADRSLIDLINRADLAAYAAKNDGRNCTRPDLGNIDPIIDSRPLRAG